MQAGAAIQGLFGYALFMGNVSIFTGAALWAMRRRLLAILPLIVSALYSIVTLQRTTFVIAILLFACAAISFSRLLGVNHPYLKRSSRTPYLVLGIMGVVGYFAILFPLQVRNRGTDNSSGWESIGSYFLSGIGGLNSRELGGATGSSPALLSTDGVFPGSYTFTSLAKLFRRLGLDLDVPPDMFDYITIRIGSVPFTSNTGTGLLQFWLDFGFYGVFGFPFVLGFVATVLQKRVAYRGAVGAVPFFCVSLVTVGWCFYGNTMLNDVRYFWMAALASLLFSGKIPIFVGGAMDDLRPRDLIGSAK